jgi:hypothetical protein
MNEEASCFPKTPKRVVVNSTNTSCGVLTPDTKSSKSTCPPCIQLGSGGTEHLGLSDTEVIPTMVDRRAERGQGL